MATLESLDERSRAFTPAQIRSDCCQARIWGGGNGGQCQRHQLRRGLCSSHLNWFEKSGLSHGLVTEPIPEGKLVEFELSAMDRSAPSAGGSSLEPKLKRRRTSTKATHQTLRSSASKQISSAKKLVKSEEIKRPEVETSLPASSSKTSTTEESDESSSSEDGSRVLSRSLRRKLAPDLPAAMNHSFLQSRCDEDGFFGTWHDFLTVPENEHGGFVELKDKKKKKYLGGRYGEIIDLLADKCKHHPAGLEHIVKAAEKTESKTHKALDKGKEHKLPVWEESDSSSSD
eukprot:s3246_g2.t1